MIAPAVKTRHARAAQEFVRREIETSPSLQMLFVEIEQDRRQREQQSAIADPKAHRLSRVFPPGVHTGYRYFSVKAKARPEVRFCYSVNRNVAGRFLIWRETVTRKTVKRDRWDAMLRKEHAIHACRLYRDELVNQRAKRAQQKGPSDA